MVICKLNSFFGRYKMHPEPNSSLGGWYENDFCCSFTSYLELRAAHPPQLAVDRVYFFDQRHQDGITDPL